VFVTCQPPACGAFHGRSLRWLCVNSELYSLESSEEILGRALKDYANRDDVVVCTVVHGIMRASPNGQGLSRKAIMTEIEHSLRRLGTDYVDVYMIHPPDNQTPLERNPGTPSRRLQRRKGPLPRRVVNAGIRVRVAAGPSRHDSKARQNVGHLVWPVATHDSKLRGRRLVITFVPTTS
jgi:hypothetical protein